MIRGLYSAATGLDAAMLRQNQTAENLAHLSTPGYRGKGMLFETFDQSLAETSAGHDITGTHPIGVYTDFQPGPFQHTGNRYHVAIDGDSFFALQTPQGVVHSRNGTFHLDSTGQLLSEGNYPVLGNAGPITIPQEAKLVSIGEDGSISADGNPVDQLRLTRFSNPQQLQSIGPTLFSAPAEAGAQPAVGKVRQGYLEASNVSAPTAMIELIQAARYFEAAQRALRAISDSVQLNTRPGG